MVALTGLAVVAALFAVPGPAQAASAEESRLLTLVNGVRASAGAPALVHDEAIAAVARRWASSMAAAGTISHNPALGSQVTGWSKIAENVGTGPNLDTVHRALVASPSHYANMTDRQVTLVGIGVVTSGGRVFVVENFMRPSGSAPPRAVAPTTVAPAPTPRATAPPTTVKRVPVTTTVPARPAPSAPVTTVPIPPVELSPWLALAIELTRGW
jgi:hypothetical protein